MASDEASIATDAVRFAHHILRVVWTRHGFVGCGKPQAHRIVRVVVVAIDAVRCAHRILLALSALAPRWIVAATFA